MAVPRIVVPQVQETVGSPGGFNVPTNSTAFGAAKSRVQEQQGDALQKVGQAFFEVAGRIRKREQAVRTAKNFDLYRELARDEFIREQSEGEDFTTSKSLMGFGSKLNELMEAVVNQDPDLGSDGKAKLTEMMIKERGSFMDAASQRSVQNQRALVDRQFGDFVAGHVNMASQAPDVIGSLYADIDSRLDAFSDVYTPEQQEVLRKTGKEQVTVAALESLVALDKTKEARSLIELATTNGALSPDNARQFNTRVTVAEVQREKAQTGKAAAMRRLQEAGVDTSNPRIALALEGINFPATIPLPGEATTKGAGVFGKGAVGLASEFMARNAPGFANGELSAEDDRFFLQSVAIFQRPDPITGQPGRIPPDVREALRRRGYNPDRFGEPGADGNAGQFLDRRAPAPSSFAVPQEQAPQAQQSQAAVPGEDSELAGSLTEGNFGFSRNTTTEVVEEQPIQELPDELKVASEQLESFEQETRQFEAEGGVLSPAATAPPITLFDSADLLTGPVSGIRNAVAGTAFVGQVFPAPEIRRARRFMESFKQDFVRILQNNPKYPVSEREAILESLNLESDLLGEPEAFRQDLIGLDDFLSLREQNARETIESGTVGKNEREQMLNVLNAIGKAREVLGVPKLMNSRAEVELAVEQGILLPGSTFRTPDGRILRVPAQRAN